MPKVCTGGRVAVGREGIRLVPPSRSDADAFRESKNPPSAETSFVPDCWFGKRGPRARERFVTVLKGWLSCQTEYSRICIKITRQSAT